MTTPEAALVILDVALSNEMKAEFPLFDFLFATNQFLQAVHGKGIHFIAMAKDLNFLLFLARQKDGTKKRMKIAGLYHQVFLGGRNKGYPWLRAS